MKKLLFLSLLAIPIFGETYDLNYFLNNQKENFIVNISEKRDITTKSQIKSDNYNEINFVLSSERKKEDTLTHNNNLKISYGDFFYNISKETYPESTAFQSIGFNKNLNSFIYGEKTFKENNFEFEKKLRDLNNLKTKNDININIIKTYGNLLKIQEKIKLQKNYRDNILIEKINMKKRSDSGDISSIDLEAFNLEEKSINLELENLVKELSLEKNELFTISGVYFSSNDILKPLELLEELDTDNVGKNDLSILETKKEQLKEVSKHDLLKDRLQFDFKSEYTLNNDNYSIGLSLSNKFKLKDYDKVQKNIDMDEIEYLIREQKIKIKNLKEEYLSKYQIDLSNLNLDKEKLELNKKSLIIKEKLYANGELSYIDYLKEVEKFQEKEKSVLEKEIDLAVLLNSIKYY